MLLVLMLGSGAMPTVAEDDARSDVCLEVAAAALASDAWPQVVREVEAMVATRPDLFPSPAIEASSYEAMLGAATLSLRLDIDAGPARPGAPAVAGTCLEPGLDWTARFGQAFLQAGADRMLAEAPTTPGIDSSVDIEWYPAEDRLRTTLVFAGPLDIPNGTCWIDDVLSIDGSRGLAVASGEPGLRTSPFAEGACGRFHDHLPYGGAGEQALALFPARITLDDGSTLRFVATRVSVTEAAVVVGGALERR